MALISSRNFKKVLLITFVTGFFIWILIVDSGQNNFPFSGNCHFGKKVVVQVDFSFERSFAKQKSQLLPRPKLNVFNETHDKAIASVIPVIPVLVLGCDRVTAISSHLEQLFKARATFLSGHDRFPIIVSLDCNDAGTTAKVRSFGDDVKLIEQPDQSQIVVINIEATKNRHKKLRNVGYHKIARHYKWALDHIFLVLNYSAVIVTEDDLNVAPDFFEYFAATYPLLVKDKSLWCVSAWNDNSKPQLILKDRPELLHRTDFFPGLGWMMRRDLWLELSPKFPKAYWDDWMRNPEQRKDRACIRPEISRTTTFGRNGFSGGQFFDTYLEKMQLNSKYVSFTKLNLSYLEKDNYDSLLIESVNNATEISLSDLCNNSLPSSSANSLCVTYESDAELKNLASGLSAMSDFKSGVIRTAYQGVVTLAWNSRRLFLVPTHSRTGYEAN